MRPPGLNLWIKNARKKSILPLKFPDQFKTEFHAWWKLCNPPWRECDNEGYLIMGASGDWSSMFVPGTNGFCMVIAGLVGLLEVEDAGEWAFVFDDVLWVVQQLITAKKAEL